MGNTIDEIIETAFSKLKTMADADTIIGKPIKSEDGTVIIPVSKVTMGFVAGGGEYSEVTLAGKKKSDKDYPFAGGSGAGMSITPIAFVSVGSYGTQVFSIDQKTPMQKIYDMVPEILRKGLEKVGAMSDKTHTSVTDIKENLADEKIN